MSVFRSRLLAASLLAFAGSSSASVLFDNGGFVTNPTGGTGSIAGLPISQPQPVPNSSLTSTIPGINATAEFGQKVAEDFVVPSQGWDLDSVRLFAFQSSQSTPTVSKVKINLWTAPPFDANSPAPVPNPLPTPLLAQSIEVTPTPQGIVAYRQLGTTSTSSSSRAIFAYDVSLDGLPDAGRLTEGTYWLEWSFAGFVGTTSQTQVTNPIVTPREGAPNLNARQFALANINGTPTTTWFESREIRYQLIGTTHTGFFDQPMALPFVLSGSPIPEPGSMGTVLIAGMMLNRRPRAVA